MISYLFNLFFYQPLYNALVFLVGIVPLEDVGIAVIVLTIIVKLILFPLSQKALRTQQKMKEIDEPMKLIKEKFKDNPEQLTKETIALYRKYEINPFSGFLTLLIQIPVFFALYWVFMRGGLPEIHTNLLYSFVNISEIPNMQFLGLINIHEKSILLASLAAISQGFQAHFSLASVKLEPTGNSFKDDMMRGMHLQMRYVLPVIIFFGGLAVAGAVSLYWTVSNIFTIGQEIYLRRTGLKTKN